ncbi:MAG: hypothetical protein EOO38_07035 [Cytophagaceae bacterium]|nr:MAG: hypothetical protein EOO38_07035 [Cytophagaceae bacterium]
MFGLFKKTPPSPFLASVLEDLAAGRYSKPRHDNSSYIKRYISPLEDAWHIWPSGELWRTNQKVLLMLSERRIVIEAWHTAMKIAKLEYRAEQMKLRG